MFSPPTLSVTPPEPVRHELSIDPNMMPRTIPPEHKHRTLVLCFDGTGDQFDNDNSNIVQLFSMLKKDDRTKQMVYYQSGIGTYTSPDVATPFMTKIHKKIDEMIACDLDAHVMDGYEFLMQNHIEGDKICIFGFSRGAYTARSLAGMLHKVGLLPPDNTQQVPFAYRLYTRTDACGWAQSNAFKKAFSIDVNIEFIGVWDTVSAVGLIPRRLPFTTSNTIVKTFRHALSLDERRARFKANLWNRPTAREALLDRVPVAKTRKPKPKPKPKQKRQFTASNIFFPTPIPHPNTAPPSTTPRATYRNHIRHASSTSRSSEEDNLLDEFESRYGSPRPGKETDVEEVWFSGCHCDVGGGSVENSVRHTLARISLRWMVRECFKTQTGIMFHSDRLREIGLDPAGLYPMVIPRPPPAKPREQDKEKEKEQEKKPSLRNRILQKLGVRPKPKTAPTKLLEEKLDPLRPRTPVLSEEEEELNDCLSPMYDQLKLCRSWWILEYLPMEYRYQTSDNEWRKYFGMNRAIPRYIPGQRRAPLKVHRSVNLRMQFYEKHGYTHRNERPKKKYKPKAHFKSKPLWVD